MRDHEDVPYIVIERQTGGFGAFLWGAMLGAAAAVLLAPRSGAETQEEIRQRVDRIRRAAEDRVDSVRTSYDTTRTRIEDRVDAVREQVSTVRSQIDEKAGKARETLDSARRAARDARSELERRVSDVKGSSADSAGGTPEVVVTDVSDERTENNDELG